MATTRLTFSIPSGAAEDVGLQAMLDMEGQAFPVSWVDDGAEFTEQAHVEKVQQSGAGVQVTLVLPGPD